MTSLAKNSLIEILGTLIVGILLFAAVCSVGWYLFRRVLL